MLSFSIHPGEESRVRKLCARFFGRILADYEMFGLCGLPWSGELTAGVFRNGILAEYDTVHPVAMFGECRIVRRNNPERLELWNETLQIRKPQERGRGIGLSCFCRQVYWCMRFGIARIKTVGGRKPGENGYYTWARFGFEARLPSSFGCPSLLDLMSTDRGRKLWLDKGFELEMFFDLGPQSRSLHALKRYVHAGLAFCDRFPPDRGVAKKYA